MRTQLNIASVMTLICAVIVPLASGMAASEQIKIVQSAPYISHNAFGVTFDLGGIRLGMLDSEVLAKAESSNVDRPIETRTSSLSVVSGSNVVKSEPYVSLLAIKQRDPHRNWRIHFGTPSTGVRVLAIDLTEEYSKPKVSPTVKDTIAQLEKKFGVGTKVSHVDDDQSLTEKWAFGRNGSISCSAIVCYAAGSSPDFSSLPELSYLQRQGKQIIVSAGILVDKTDPTHVIYTQVNIEDVSNELLNLGEAKKQLEHAASTP